MLAPSVKLPVASTELESRGEEINLLQAYKMSYIISCNLSNEEVQRKYEDCDMLTLVTTLQPDTACPARSLRVAILRGRHELYDANIRPAGRVTRATGVTSEKSG